MSESGRTKIAKIIWMTSEENEKLESMSRNTGMYQSVIIRKLIRNAVIEPKPNPEIRELVRSVERIGNEVHQIMHLAGQTGQITKEQIANTEQLIREIKAEVRKWL